MPARIAIVTGGTSTERDVSLWSAVFVECVLADRFDVSRYALPEDLPRLLADRTSIAAAVPIIHGKGGEDGTIQGFLRTLGIPFIFSDVAAHAIGLHKAHAKAIVHAHGLMVANACRVKRDDPAVFERPVVVKPIEGGSTIGTTIARSPDEFIRALQTGFACGDELLVEDVIVGDEFTVPVIEERGEALALPVIQILSNGLFDFEKKYVDGALAKHVSPAPIADELAARLADAACTAHTAIGARHASRTDFIVDQDGTIWFLEINTIPGMTAHSFLPEAVANSGRDFGALLERWVREAISG